jgi:hypothetical protein
LDPISGQDVPVTAVTTEGNRNRDLAFARAQNLAGGLRNIEVLAGAEDSGVDLGERVILRAVDSGGRAVVGGGRVE